MMDETFGPYAPTKQFVLCFDGTGNKFSGDGSDTNLVKIYRVSRFPPDLFVHSHFYYP